MTEPLWNKIAESRAAHAMLIAFAALVIYSNSLHGPMIFDDFDYVASNPAIMSLHNFMDAALGRQKLANSNLITHFQDRIVVFATFAADYAVHGNATLGYHAVNLAIHIAAALTLYWLGLMLFRSSASPGIIALWGALLFTVHPLQTDAVSDISQRFTSLAALFYLLSLALYVRSRLQGDRRRSIMLYALSAVCVLLAARSKEIAFTLPAAMVLVEVCFLDGPRGLSLKRILPWTAIVMIIPATLFFTVKHDIVNAANFRNISSWEYLLTEQRVMLTYMRLLVLPLNQNVQYDYPIYGSLLQWQVFLPAAVNLSLIAAAGYLYLRSRREGSGHLRWASFGILWFYLTLSVESSIVPLDDLIYEHRLYLPIAGLALALSALGVRFYGRLGGAPSGKAFALAAAAAVLALSLATYNRNPVFQDLVAFWTDAAEESPDKPLVLHNLANAYISSGDPGRAIPVLEHALSLVRPGLRPEDDTRENVTNRVQMLNTLGVAYMRTGEAQKAISTLEKAVSLFPPDIERKGATYHDDAVWPLYNLALLYSATGDTERSDSAIQRASLIDSDELARLLQRRK